MIRITLHYLDVNSPIPQMCPSCTADDTSLCSLAKAKVERLLTGTKEWKEQHELSYCVLEHYHDYLLQNKKHGNCMCFSQSLIRTGQHLNSLMDYRTAITCFNCSLCLLIDEDSNSSSGTKSVSMCHAFSTLVHTCLLVKDIDCAVSMINQYKGFLLDIQPQTEQLSECLGNSLLDVGLALVDSFTFSTAKSLLEESRQYLINQDERYAKLLGALGYCYLCLNKDSCTNHLLDAIDLWRKLGYPPYECQSILNTMKHFCEARLTFNNHMEYFDDTETNDFLLNLHRTFCDHGLGLNVAEAFTHLGTIAFNRMHETKAVDYFSQALSLYKEGSQNEGTKENICKLLRFLGVSNYNCRQYQSAVHAYEECLTMLQSKGGTANLRHVAECCAALGFSYSRLQSFDHMLKYYEKALELKLCLSPEDLELIETNIGSLYQVKAVMCEREKDSNSSHKYFTLAERAFTNALRYSWKSFPFVNYGYYLLCRRHYGAAISTLQQAYLNGVIDHDTVEFDHTEEAILLTELRDELEGLSDIRVPAPVIALYLKATAQLQLGDVVGTKSTAQQLNQEILATRFTMYYTLGFGEDRMKALCFSLLGYVHRSVGDCDQASAAFRGALEIVPDYTAARKNLMRDICDINAM